MRAVFVLLAAVHQTAQFSTRVGQILVISCAFSLASISNCLANFEVMFNPSLKGLRKELLTMFFFGLDALLRALTFSAAIFAHSCGWLLVLLAYLVRSAALFAIFQTRGFIYAPGEEDPRLIALAKHVGFSLVPAGLIQVVSDYPFNDLLAMSTSRICGLHVLSTWVETAGPRAFAQFKFIPVAGPRSETTPVFVSTAVYSKLNAKDL